MHEASIAQGILDTAVASLPGGKGRITRITVVAGAFTNVEGRCLEMYLSELSRGTAAEGAALEVKRPPASLVCRDCGTRAQYRNEGDLPVCCAVCGGSNRLEGGDELYVDSIEVDE